MSQLRTNPKSFVPKLQQRMEMMDDQGIYNKPGEPGLITQEGRQGVQEAIDFLNQVQPMGQLSYLDALQEITNNQAKYLGNAGTLDHTGPDGSQPSDRIWGIVGQKEYAAESIYCCPESSTVEDFIIA